MGQLRQNGDERREMKIRSGFVSNSSSSSFIVAFPKEPTSAEEVEKILFPSGGNTYGHPYYKASYPTDKVAGTVWDDIQRQKPNNEEEIWGELHGYLKGGPYLDWEKFKLPNGGYDWKAFDAEECRYRQKVMKKFVEENPGATIYCFHYGDENGKYEGALEHGGLFDHLPHITVSHH
jgi:hypothetical protein